MVLDPFLSFPFLTKKDMKVNCKEQSPISGVDSHSEKRPREAGTDFEKTGKL